jgi:hypothetical protein
MPNVVLGGFGIVIGLICAAIGVPFLHTMIILVVAFFVLKYVPIFGFAAPLSFTVPQLIKDMARASRLPVDTVPWAFFEKYGSIIVGQAKLLSPRKLEQAEFAAACARELVKDMRSRVVKAPDEWDTHVAMRRTSWTIGQTYKYPVT